MSQQAPSLESRQEVERRFHDERIAGRQLMLDACHEAIGTLLSNTVPDFVTTEESIHFV
jgi:hypothetical protein